MADGKEDLSLDLGFKKSLDALIELICRKLGEKFSATKIIKKSGSDARLSGLLVRILMVVSLTSFLKFSSHGKIFFKLKLRFRVHPLNLYRKVF
jgi:hypothetical protein